MEKIHLGGLYMNLKKITDRVDNTTHIPKEQLVDRPPFPKSVKIEITSRCNYNCSYCGHKNSTRKLGDMAPKLLYRLLRELKSLDIQEVGLFLLGEPFLVKELPMYIKYAKTIGIPYVFITTNGSLCSPEVLMDVVEAGLDSLKFSINSYNRISYKETHGVDFFDRVVNNIKWLHNYLESSGIVTLKTAASSIYVESLKYELETLRKEIEPYVDEFYYLPLYKQAGHGIMPTSVIGNPGRIENMAPPIPCWALFNATKITWDGKMTACCFDHNSDFEIADLNQVSLLEAWHHPKFVKLRNQHLSNDLRRCLCAKCLGLA